MYANNKMSWWLYLIGLVLVLGSHIYMLMSNFDLSMVAPNAYTNILAAILLAAGWLTRKA